MKQETVSGSGISWAMCKSASCSTHSPITKVFVTGDYAIGPYGCAKFGANPPVGGFWANQ